MKEKTELERKVKALQGELEAVQLESATSVCVVGDKAVALEQQLEEALKERTRLEKELADLNKRCVFPADTSVRSPCELYTFIIKNDIHRIKVSRKHSI